MLLGNRFAIMARVDMPAGSVNQTVHMVTSIADVNTGTKHDANAEEDLGEEGGKPSPALTF